MLNKAKGFNSLHVGKPCEHSKQPISSSEFRKMPSLPGLRPTLKPRYAVPSSQRRESKLDPPETERKTLNERFDRLLPSNYASVKEAEERSLKEAQDRVLPVFKYETDLIEVKLNDCSGEKDVPGKGEGVFTEKCSVKFMKAPVNVDDDINSSDPGAFLGSLNIVVRLECENPKSGMQVHRLKNMKIGGFGPTKWTILAFYEDEEVFVESGISYATKDEDVNLGDFEFSFFC